MNISDLKNKSIAIWGLGSEGWSTLKFLKKKFPGKQIYIFNDKEFSNDTFNILSQDPFLKIVLGKDIRTNLKNVDVIIRSPGVSIYKEEIEYSKKQGIKISSSTNLWFSEHINDKKIVVTGTKGKSTTSSIITHLLRNSGLRVTLGGNIGTPMIDMLNVEPRPDIWVMELSSYQISDLEYSPEIGVLLNLFPEHLDWHINVDNYYNDKLNLFKHQKNTDISILNKEDINTQNYTKNLDIKNIYYFNDENQFHVKDNSVYYKKEKIFDGKNMPIPGNHNLSNLCAALTIMNILNIDFKNNVKNIVSFKGLPHRLYPCGIKDDILYIDDSISTTPESSIAALETYKYKKITILVGGFDRGLDFEKFSNYVLNNKHVFSVITMPDNGYRIAETIKKQKNVNNINSSLLLYETNSLEEAIIKAKEITEKNGIILLSPGSPSYGRFKNFAERGDTFAKLSGF